MKFTFNPGEDIPAESFQTIDPDNIVGQSAGYLVGGSNPSALSVFNALGGGSNDGKLKINIDGIVYDNLGIDLNNVSTPEIIFNQTVAYDPVGVGGSNQIAQTFTMPSDKQILTSIGIDIYRWAGPSGNYYVKLYAVDGEGKPTGSPIKTITNAVSSLPTSHSIVNFTFNQMLSPSTKYCFVVSADNNQVGAYHKDPGTIANENMLFSSNSGATWSASTGDMTFNVYVASYANTYNSIATALQTAIRTATGGLETVIYDTNHFKITSASLGRDSKVLKLMTPTTGTDISGAGATTYLDCGTNGVETAGNGMEYYLVRLGSDGKIPKGLTHNGENQITSGRVLGTVYQNTSKNPILVSASVNYSDTNNGQPYVYADIGATSSPATRVSYFKLSLFTASSTATLTFVVPPNYYYKVDSNAGGTYGAKSIANWFECDLI